ncbi:MAG: hypothetical protein U0802_12400 [Candidatus Binatia bacterium]
MRSAAPRSAASSSPAPEAPGTTGTPAAAMISRAPTLLPMRRIASGGGPTKHRPAAAQRAAKSAFSARKP